MKIKIDKDSEMVKALLLHVTKLRKEIESDREPVVFQSSLRTILLDLERELSNRSLDTKNLSQNAYGIFRLVTESSELESSSFGKDLSAPHHKIRDFISMLESQ